MKDIEDLTDEELKQEFEICEREMENRDLLKDSPRIKCNKCGSIKHVYFRSSMEYLCDDCIYKGLEE